MLTGQTMEQLKTMRLDALAAAWAEQQKNPEVAGLSFDERLGLLVDAEHLFRENRRLRLLLTTPSSGSATPASRTSTTTPNASSTRQLSASSPPAAGCRSTTR